ncbi:MAG: dienelactone hydrolase family protein [Acidobacteriota bacterium]
MPGNMEEFLSNGKKTRGYLAVPGSRSGPAVIVIQEWWGLVGHIQNVTDRFAEAGCVALAPDLHHGKSTRSPDEAGKLMMALNMEQAETHLQGAVEHLVAHSATRVDKVGVVGFCMGGQLALFAASKNLRIGACVDFYGIHPNVKPDYARITAPVLGLFAEKDAFVKPDTVRELDARLKNAGVQTDFHIYSGVDHAFFNDERAEAYNPEAATDAWNRVMDFFGKYLEAA